MAETHVKPVRWSAVHLDAIRGAAALFVLVNHLRAVFFVDYEKLDHKSSLASVVYLLTGLGHQSVMVFFILSGYLIASSIRRTLKAQKWDWKRYFLNRIVRLQIVLLPALILGGLWDYVGLHHFGSGGIYGGGPGYQSFVTEPVAGAANLLTGVGNFFFLQEILVKPFGSNGALWSLSFEFWYYLLFPLFLLGFSKLYSLPVRLILLVAALLISVFVGQVIMLLFLVWLMGAALAFAKVPAFTKTRTFALLSAVALVATLSLSRFHVINNIYVKDFLLGGAFLLVLTYVTQCDEEPKRWSGAYRAVARGVSHLSYTLYLVHLPVLFFLNSILIGTAEKWQPSPLHLVWISLIFVVILVYAYLVWLLAESKTERVKAVLARGLGI